MRSLGQNPTDDDLRDMINEIDTDGKNFRTVMSLGQNPIDDDLRFMIDEIDTDGKSWESTYMARN